MSSVIFIASFEIRVLGLGFSIRVVSKGNVLITIWIGHPKEISVEIQNSRNETASKCQFIFLRTTRPRNLQQRNSNPIQVLLLKFKQRTINTCPSPSTEVQTAKYPSMSKSFYWSSNSEVSIHVKFHYWSSKQKARNFDKLFLNLKKRREMKLSYQLVANLIEIWSQLQ